jgi:hypothetical protein
MSESPVGPASPEHALLAADAGTWEADIEFRPAPGAPPQTSRGVSNNRMLGGRWLIADFRNETGFEGHGIYGWDPVRRKYTGTWVDSLRSFLAVAEGTYDDASRTLTLWAEARLPDRLLRWREVTERPDEDTRLFRILVALDGGGEFAPMTVRYRRRR